ncbi:MAG: branched-chain amino acid ABC transporter permease, partial [Pseudomonadota bacterium]
MDVTLFIVQFLNGVQLGVLLFLLASGLTLTFGIMDFVNLAHGSLYMLGAFFCASLTLWTGSFIWGIVLALPVMALAGLLIEISVIRHLYVRDHLDHVLATFGMILCFDALVQIIWGPAGIAVPLPEWLNSQITLTAGVPFPVFRLLIIVIGLIIAIGIYILVSHTRIGMLIRAGASNRTMVSALGINIEMLFAFVFALGAMLAGLAGMLIAPITGASVGMGNGIIITALVVIIVGGIGSIKGAFVAALLIGLIDTLGRSYLDGIFKLAMPAEFAETAAPAVSAMLIYILMATILAVRPAGLFP